MEKKEKPSEDSRQITYKVLSSSLYDEDLAFNAHYVFVHGWSRYHNKHYARVASKRHKFNQYTER